MYKVGITGGIGSGKSKVCELLRDVGVAVYNSDIEAKRLMSEDEGLRLALTSRFGDMCYIDGVLNRAYLAEKVFSNGEELSALNAIVHPVVMEDFDRWAEQQEGDYVVMESAILYESNLEDRVDVVVAVMAPENLRLERAMCRDGATEEQIRERMRNQISDEERCERSKYAVVNIELDDLEEDVEQLHRRLSYDARANHA